MAGEVSQRPASSLKALIPAAGLGQPAEGIRDSQWEPHRRITPVAASEESVKSGFPSRHGFSYSMDCHVLGQLRARELGQVLSASPGPTSRSDG